MNVRVTIKMSNFRQSSNFRSNQIGIMQSQVGLWIDVDWQLIKLSLIDKQLKKIKILERYSTFSLVIITKMGSEDRS